MKIFPAIDLLNKRCVRLRRGRVEEATVYSDDPVAVALKWQGQGGEYLHVVDLDGAFEGAPRHTRIISEIIAALSIPVQVGGGLRTDAHVRELLDVGVARVILGTRAIEEPEALKILVAGFGDKIAVGIDARNGFVQIKGWIETTDIQATDLATRMADIGVRTIIYTDTATDGMMKGPNIPGMAAMCDAVPTVNIVASGGVSCADDVRRLAELNRNNLEGVIVGKALYEKTTTIPELLKILLHL
jgi:phosphoribosylformimino-5-aminoimidazole carboxamide ribotide isomerase